MKDSTPPKRVGRPRDPAVEERILDVTLAQLREQGYARLSIDQVAAESGIGKPAVYRRWKGKADLATAALRKLRISEPEVTDRSTLVQLRAMVENFRRSLLRPFGMALVGTVLAEEAHAPELLRLFRERLIAPRGSMLRSVLKRAKARGELHRGAAIEPAVALLVGAIYAQYLAESKVSAAFARKAVDIVWTSVRK